MPRSSYPQVIIANRLTDGVVVFLAETCWLESIDGARIAGNPDESETLLAIANRAEADSMVVDPYLIDVDITGGRPIPVAGREAIRTTGPTVSPFHPMTRLRDRTAD